MASESISKFNIEINNKKLSFNITNLHLEISIIDTLKSKKYQVKLTSSNEIFEVISENQFKFIIENIIKKNKIQIEENEDKNNICMTLNYEVYDKTFPVIIPVPLLEISEIDSVLLRNDILIDKLNTITQTSTSMCKLIPACEVKIVKNCLDEFILEHKINYDYEEISKCIHGKFQSSDKILVLISMTYLSTIGYIPHSDDYYYISDGKGCLIKLGETQYGEEIIKEIKINYNPNIYLSIPTYLTNIPFLVMHPLV